MPRAWYAYDGVGDPYSLTSYSLSGVTPGCLDGDHPCAIFIYNGDLDPTGPFSHNIQTYLSNLLVTAIAQPQFPGGTKKYVYGKRS